MLRGLVCRTCKEEKHDTAFRFKKVAWYNIWSKLSFELDLSKCLDCEYPDRWDEIKKELKNLNLR